MKKLFSLIVIVLSLAFASAQELQQSPAVSDTLLTAGEGGGKAIAHKTAAGDAARDIKAGGGNPRGGVFKDISHA